MSTAVGRAVELGKDSRALAHNLKLTAADLVDAVELARLAYNHLPRYEVEQNAMIAAGDTQAKLEKLYRQLLERHGQQESGNPLTLMRRYAACAVTLWLIKKFGPKYGVYGGPGRYIFLGRLYDADLWGSLDASHVVVVRSAGEYTRFEQEPAGDDFVVEARVRTHQPRLLIP